MTDPMKTRLRERVARKFHERLPIADISWPESGCEQCLELADAAISEIAAFLEEPTIEALDFAWNHVPTGARYEDLKPIWQVMLKAMLRTDLAGGG